MLMIIITTIMMIIVMIVASKGAIGDFFNLLTAPRTVS